MGNLSVIHRVLQGVGRMVRFELYSVHHSFPFPPRGWGVPVGWVALPQLGVGELWDGV